MSWWVGDRRGGGPRVVLREINRLSNALEVSS